MENISQMTTEERLEKLEIELARAKRRYRLLLAVILLTAIVMVAGMRTRENIIKANAFILIDENGKTRAGLAVDKDGPGLTIYDKNDKARAWLGIDESRPALRLRDENGKARTWPSMGESNPVLRLRNENGKVRAAIGIGLMVLIDENGMGRASLGMNEDVDMPWLDLADKTGMRRALLGVGENRAELTLRDENGKDRARLTVLKDGPRLRLYDENDNLRAALGVSQTTTPDGKVITYPESSLLLFKPDGKVLWEAPP